MFQSTFSGVKITVCRYFSKLVWLDLQYRWNFIFIFQQWTLLHQNLTRNLKIIGPLFEYNFPRGYDVISNDVIFQLCVHVRVWKIKLWFIFVHVCATFNLEYEFLDTSTTLDAKVLEYSPEGNSWRHIGKMENFGDIWWSVLSLCIISVVEFKKISQQAKCKSNITNFIKRDVKLGLSQSRNIQVTSCC